MGKMIVFGATGTLGAQIAIHMRNEGYDVVAVGHRETDNGFFADFNIPYFSCDISERESFLKLPQKGVSAVLDFAGALPASMQGYNPDVYISSIVQGTLNVLDYTMKVGAERIVFPQSLFDISYLFGSKVPIPPDSERRAPLDGDHALYVIAKNAAVDLIEHYHCKYGLKRFILRLSRVYMFHPNPFTYTDGIKCMVSDRYLIDRAMNGYDLELWGDPNRLLETVCVKDFLQIVQRSIESPLEGGIYNIGSGGSTLKERIEGIIDVFSPGGMSKIIYCPEKRSTQQFVLDIRKTVNELGYIPKYNWHSYLMDFKEDMKTEPFAKLWGRAKDYLP